MKRNLWKCGTYLFFSFVSLVLISTLYIFLDGGILSANATEGEKIIKLDTSRIEAGSPLSFETYNFDRDSAEYRWYTGGTTLVASGGALGMAYTPTAGDYEKWIRVEAWDGGEKLAEDSIWFSKLPVLYINTDDGNPVTSKGEYKPATMKVQNNGTCPATDKYMDYEKMELKVRGNSTSTWPKKPYKVKLDSKTDMFGMGENKHWVLLANYLDESLMRNTTAARLSEELGLVTMDTVWVDVVINGEYAGNYQLCEHIRVGKERVDIADWEDVAGKVASKVYDKEKAVLTKADKASMEEQLKTDLSWVVSGQFVYDGRTYVISDYYSKLDGDISGGYLFELSEEYDEVSKFKTPNGLKVMVNTPEYLYTSPVMMAYAEEYWKNFEGAYRAENGYVDIDGTGRHYSQLADMDSMVAYWLVMEVMGNNDAVYKSRYAYKDKGGLLKFGPVWDFDWGCGSSVVGTAAGGWKISKGNHEQNFFMEFLDDPLFLCKATEKYWENHEYIMSLIEDGGMIDGWYQYLAESGQADMALWDRHDIFANPRGFDRDYEMFKKYLQDRVAWLDRQFATDAALLESTRCEYSASPYYRAGDRLGITVLNGTEDTVTVHAPADYVTCVTDDLYLSVGVDDPATETVEFYVNGLYRVTIPVDAGGTVDAVLKGEWLTADLGKKNVMSLIARDANGAATYRNFTTVARLDGGHMDADGDNHCDTCRHVMAVDAVVKGHSLSLDGDIGVNFYMEIGSGLLNEREKYKVRFILPDGSVTYEDFPERAVAVDGKEYYVLSCDVAAKEMTGVIRMQIVENGMPVGEEHTYTARQYAEFVLDPGNGCDDGLKGLVKAMLDYGGCSQKYFNYNTGALANEGLDAPVLESVTAETLAAYRPVLQSNSLVRLMGANLTLESLTTLRLYFTRNTDAPLAFYCGGRELEQTVRDGYTCVEISDIGAKDLDRVFTVEVTDGSTSYGVAYSVLTYCYNVLSKETSASINGELKDTVRALYLYNQAANAYFGD